MDISSLYQLFLKCSAVTIDSRTCPRGAMFFALRGKTFDGNAFARKALDAGCACAVIDNRRYFAENDGRYILVENSLLTMQALANYHRRKLRTPLIAITGTNGKTTTKELVAAVLSRAYNVHYTRGNLNNYIGVPLTLLDLKPEHELAVVEMGASCRGDIEELAEIADPDYGIITNIGRAHLGGFGSMETLVKTKGELFDYLKQKEGYTVFVYENDINLRSLSMGMNKVTYGEGSEADVSGQLVSCSPYMTFKWKSKKIFGEEYTVKTKLVGDYNLPNALAAIAVGLYFKVSPEEINAALARYAPTNSRSQLKRAGSNTLIIDAYNANPTSMMAALKSFRQMDSFPKMVILGDMRELGAVSLKEHLRVVEYLKESGFAKVWLVGQEFAATKPPFRTFANVGEVISELKANTPQGYTILIKGSNGIRLSEAADFLSEE